MFFEPQWPQTWSCPHLYLNNILSCFINFDPCDPLPIKTFPQIVIFQNCKIQPPTGSFLLSKIFKRSSADKAWGNLNKNSELVVLQDADIFFFIISGVALSVCIQRKKRSKLGGHTEPLFREYYTIQLTIFAIICWLKQLIV